MRNPKHHQWLSVLLFAGLLAGSCSGSSSEPGEDTVNADVVTEVSALDQSNPSDVGADAVDLSTPDQITVPDECYWKNVPRPEPDLATKKFGLTLFHFNIQYVVGGLEREGDDFPLFCGDLCAGWTDEKLNDWYIEVAFEPVLDMYLKHPTWGVNFEMQAFLIEWMRDRYPATLAKLQGAVQSGQVEISSLHYSDQFFLAFPRYDLQKSQELTADILLDSCIPLSPVVFNQEGQDGVGKHDFMAANGYSIDVYPVNLYRFYHWEQPIPFYYRNGDVDVVVGPGEGYLTGKEFIIQKDEERGLEVTWTFFDDGDLLSFPPSPYLAPLTDKEQLAEEMAKYEERLEGLEEQGFSMMTVSRYVDHLKAHDVPQTDLPAVLDGTWQPIDTQSVWRWLGGRSIAGYASYERDNDMRTANYRIRTRLEAADRLLAEAVSQDLDVSGELTALKEAWRHMFLAEVSDATGITPWPGEFDYGLEHNAAALSGVDSVVADTLTKLNWNHALVDLFNGTVTELDAIPEADEWPTVEAPMYVPVLAQSREYTTTWQGNQTDQYLLTLTFGPGGDPTGEDEEQCRVSVQFPRTEEVIAYTPALLEDQVVEIPISELSYQAEEAWLPLSNGLIGLGNDWWVIKDCRTVHIAARVPHSEPYIEFIDATAAPEGNRTWKFLLFHGSREDALELATRTNIKPVVVL